MRAFRFYVRDEHQPVTVHLSALLRDEGRAREFAAMHLARSPDRLSVEVREDGAVLFSVMKPASPAPEAA